MINVPDILTTKIIAELFWTPVKIGASSFKEYLRGKMEKWALNEEELDALTKFRESIPTKHLQHSNPDFIEACLDGNETVKKILDRVNSPQSSQKTEINNNSGQVSVSYGNNSPNQIITNNYTSEKKN